MFIMQAHVIRQEIKRSIIRERLWDRDRRVPRSGGLSQGCAVEDVVFGDEVARAGMQGAREEGAEDQIYEGVGGGVCDEEVVEGQLGEDVEEVDVCEGELVDEHGAEGVEEDLEGAEEGFAEEGVEEEDFEGGGEVGVEAVDPEGFVVGQVVGLEKGEVMLAPGSLGVGCLWGMCGGLRGVRLLTRKAAL